MDHVNGTLIVTMVHTLCPLILMKGNVALNGQNRMQTGMKRQTSRSFGAVNNQFAWRPYFDMHRQEAQSESSGSIIRRHRAKVRTDGKEIKMKIKQTKTTTDLAPEGEHPAKLAKVGYKNEDKKCLLTFETGPEEKKHFVTKEVPSSLDAGHLRKDLELLNGSTFTTEELENGIEPEQFVGRKCRVLIEHKRTSGGRMVALVSVLLKLSNGADTQAPAEAVQSLVPAPVSA